MFVFLWCDSSYLLQVSIVGGREIVCMVACLTKQHNSNRETQQRIVVFNHPCMGHIFLGVFRRLK